MKIFGKFLKICNKEDNAVLAQMEEQLPCKHQVVGSIPTCGTKNNCMRLGIILPLVGNSHKTEASAKLDGLRTRRKIMEKRAVKVGRSAWKADRGRNTMGIVLPLLRHDWINSAKISFDIAKQMIQKKSFRSLSTIG